MIIKLLSYLSVNECTLCSSAFMHIHLEWQVWWWLIISGEPSESNKESSQNVSAARYWILYKFISSQVYMAGVQMMVCFWVSAPYDKVFFVMVCQRNMLPFCVGWLNWFRCMQQLSPQEHNLLSCSLDSSVQFHVAFSFLCPLWLRRNLHTFSTVWVILLVSFNQHVERTWQHDVMKSDNEYEEDMLWQLNKMCEVTEV